MRDGGGGGQGKSVRGINPSNRQTEENKQGLILVNDLQLVHEDMESDAIEQEFLSSKWRLLLLVKCSNNL
jgi:hypothetical protein